ncbi:MAG: hypothetical protein ACD_23C00920G0002, partial [uncultured bacterium]
MLFDALERGSRAARGGRRTRCIAT